MSCKNNWLYFSADDPCHSCVSVTTFVIRKFRLVNSASHSLTSFKIFSPFSKVFSISISSAITFSISVYSLEILYSIADIVLDIKILYFSCN